MALLRPRLHSSDGVVTDDYAIEQDPVLRLRRLLPGPQTVVVGIGVGRLALGGVFLAAPVVSTRVLGLDTATAKRVTFLARMAAARDIGLGAGTLNAGPTAAAAPWLLAGAASDAVDAVVIAGAMKQGTARGIPAAGVVVGALATAAIALHAVLGLRRGELK